MQKQIKIVDKIQNVVIYSDQIKYFKNEEKIISLNNSRAVFDEKIITAKEFEFKRNEQELNAKTNVKIVDKIQNVVIYSDQIKYFKNEEKIISLNNSGQFLMKK